MVMAMVGLLTAAVVFGVGLGPFALSMGVLWIGSLVMSPPQGKAADHEEVKGHGVSGSLLRHCI